MLNKVLCEGLWSTECRGKRVPGTTGADQWS